MNQESSGVVLPPLILWRVDLINIGNCMSSIHGQIRELKEKVEVLYESLERLNSQISTIVAERQQYPDHGTNLVPTREQMVPYPSPRHSSFSSVMENKNVLIDDETKADSPYVNYEPQLSAEIQVRRLTAQLTAAYNRIAVLEEQLLACRIHS